MARAATAVREADEIAKLDGRTSIAASGIVITLDQKESAPETGALPINRQRLRLRSWSA
jgi:hypothetical protein